MYFKNMCKHSACKQLKMNVHVILWTKLLLNNAFNKSELHILKNQKNHFYYNHITCSLYSFRTVSYNKKKYCRRDDL